MKTRRQLLIALGNLFFVANVTRMLLGFAKGKFLPAFTAVTASLKPAEVKS